MQKITVEITAQGFTGLTTENIEKALNHYFGASVSFSVTEIRPTQDALDLPSAVVNHCNPVNGVHASWCTGHETANQ